MFQDSDLASLVYGFGFLNSNFGFRVLGFGSGLLGFGFRRLGFGFWVSGFGFRVTGVGSRVLSFGFLDAGLRVGVEVEEARNEKKDTPVRRNWVLVSEFRDQAVR